MSAVARATAAASSAAARRIITEESLVRGLRYVTRRDAALRRIHAELGTPPLWLREPGFATLVHIILEQQVSLSSARAAFDRLVSIVSVVTPHHFLLLDDVSLKEIGFSRQKIGYCRNLAHAVGGGSLDLNALVALPDTAVRNELLKIKGVGAWTAEIYLLMALGRRDAWPGGDLALAVAIEEVKQLPARPLREELEAISLHWRPWRAVAARLLWHYYLHGRRPRPRPRG